MPSADLACRRKHACMRNHVSRVEYPNQPVHASSNTYTAGQARPAQRPVGSPLGFPQIPRAPSRLSLPPPPPGRVRSPPRPPPQSQRQQGCPSSCGSRQNLAAWRTRSRPHVRGLSSSYTAGITLGGSASAGDGNENAAKENCRTSPTRTPSPHPGRPATETLRVDPPGSAIQTDSEPKC